MPHSELLLLPKDSTNIVLKKL